MSKRSSSGSRPLKRRDLELPRVFDPSGGQNAERDMGRVQPVVRNRRFRDCHRRQAVHEGRRAERGFAGQACIEEHGLVFAEREAVRRRQFHEQVVRMLPVDQVGHTVGGFAGGQQQRIAALAHERIGAEHRAQIRARLRRTRAARSPSPCPTRTSSRRRAGRPANRKRGSASHGPRPSSRRTCRGPCDGALRRAASWCRRLRASSGRARARRSCVRHAAVCVVRAMGGRGRCDACCRCAWPAWSCRVCICSLRGPPSRRRRSGDTFPLRASLVRRSAGSVLPLLRWRLRVIGMSETTRRVQRRRQRANVTNELGHETRSPNAVKVLTRGVYECINELFRLPDRSSIGHCGEAALGDRINFLTAVEPNP